MFGGSIGLKQNFMGPMAKQHRMAVMTAGLVLNAIEFHLYASHYALMLTLIVIAIGAAATCITRTLAISRQLKEASHVDQ
ncbi:hypothetical protein D3C71_1928480 [compost metagenome]